jgi:hypothetical protein
MELVSLKSLDDVKHFLIHSKDVWKAVQLLCLRNVLMEETMSVRLEPAADTKAGQSVQIVEEKEGTFLVVASTSIDKGTCRSQTGKYALFSTEGYDSIQVGSNR